MRHFVDIKSKPCKYCGAPIGFIKSKTDKLLIVDVYSFDDEGEVTYYNTTGLYPLHKCKGRESK